MPLSDYALDNFVAPDLSKLTLCGAPELAQDVVTMNNAVLNLIFTSSWSDEVRTYFFNYIRRVSHGFYEYSMGRTALLAYIDDPEAKGNKVTGILRSITHFEQVFISAGIAVETLARYMVASKPKQNKATLKVVMEEMYANTKMPLNKFVSVYNDVKHLGSQRGLKYCPFWLTNTGIETSGTKIDWSAIHDTLQELNAISNRLLYPPSSASERLTRNECGIVLRSTPWTTGSRWPKKCCVIPAASVLSCVRRQRGITYGLD